MKYILETERLRLREFTIDDAGFIIELVNSPGWLANIGDRNIKTPEQAKEYLETGPLKSYKINGFGLSLVELKEGKVAIGMCGVLKRDSLENPDIGFALLPAYMNKGYAFEIANATMSYARDILKLSRINAITIPGNKPSIKLLEKIGFNFIKMTSSPSGEELMLFESLII
jgi:RimJ/RimL family protein N-acetyltransferase